MNDHNTILTRIVEGAVKWSDPLGIYTCDTCHMVESSRAVVPHPDNCPIGDMQRLIDGVNAHEERNYRLANERLHQALDSIHTLVKNLPGVKDYQALGISLSILKMVCEITTSLVGDPKRRKDDG